MIKEIANLFRPSRPFVPVKAADKVALYDYWNVLHGSIVCTQEAIPLGNVEVDGDYLVLSKQNHDGFRYPMPVSHEPLWDYFYGGEKEAIYVMTPFRVAPFPARQRRWVLWQSGHLYTSRGQMVGKVGSGTSGLEVVNAHNKCLRERAMTTEAAWYHLGVQLGEPIMVRGILPAIIGFEHLHKE
jgi:hypothetical protein